MARNPQTIAMTEKQFAQGGMAAVMAHAAKPAINGDKVAVSRGGGWTYLENLVYGALKSGLTPQVVIPTADPKK